MENNQEIVMSPEAIEARREYMREWRKNNPEKVKKHNKKNKARYWEKKAIEKGLKTK
ncbi:hypothetical protein ACFSO7_22390 [Bacillus sp. CGMCC 1.16607]|uniref:hypothetical protein n=1 Tax=Bacillus sp. CGMCC 1.16607 TaxID=3351842 RepID=UPI003644AB35